MNPNHLNDQYKPTLFLTIYQREKKDNDDQFKKEADHFPNFYIESHLPIFVDNKTLPGPASPLTEDSVRELGSYFAKNHKYENTPLIFENLISDQFLLTNNIGENFCIIWHCKARKQLLLFASQLEIPSHEVFIPNLIFKATKNTLNVWAINDIKPKENTILYHAPFFNIYNNGKVCLGSMVHPEKPKSFEQAVQQWETSFFQSYFTHLIINESPTQTNVVSLWIELIKSQNSFPNTELKSTNHKLKYILS